MGQVLQRVRLQGSDPLAAVGSRAEDLAEVDSGGYLRKLRVVGSEERMRKPSRRIRLSFGRPG